MADRAKNPGLELLERKVDELGLRREAEDELAQILIEQKIARLRKRRGSPRRRSPSGRA